MEKIIRCFMDFEFTSSGDRQHDLKNNGIELLSIAGVFVDLDYNVVSEYYSLVKPSLNNVLSTFCIELTHITQEDVSTARSFNEVVDEFCDFTKRFSDCSIEYYTWGDFDSFALRKSIKINNYQGPFKALRKKIKNIQPQISNSIRYKGNILKSHWGLQDIKCVYNMPVSESSHNALSDARDLNLIYTAYKKKVPFNLDFLKEYSQNLKLNKELDRKRNILRNRQLNEEIFFSIEDKEISSISFTELEYLKTLHENIDLNKYKSNTTVTFDKNILHFDNNVNIPNNLSIPCDDVTIYISKSKINNPNGNGYKYFMVLTFKIKISDKLTECIDFKVKINQNTRKFLNTFIKAIY